MPLFDYVIKQGDTKPIVTATILDATGAVVNLTGCTVQFVMRALTSNTPLIQKSATVVTPAAGTVSYTWTAQDTATAGNYMAQFVVTFGDATIQSFPVDGYLEVLIEENLTTAGGARLVSLGEVKDYLRINTPDKSRDAQLMRMIDGLTPVIEFITGPILQRTYRDDPYDGGFYFIEVRNRPILSVQQVVEYRGPIAYNLQQVAEPDTATIYSYMFEAPGRIVRRTVGGGFTMFPPGPGAVRVTYTAGFATVPTNVRDAVCELVRIHFQQTQTGRPRGGPMAADQEEGRQIMGFLVPGRVEEMLGPNIRFPAVY